MSLSKKPGKKRRRISAKETKNIGKALSRPQESKQLRLVCLIKRRKKIKIVRTRQRITLIRSSVITVKNWVTTLTNI